MIEYDCNGAAHFNMCVYHKLKLAFQHQLVIHVGADVDVDINACQKHSLFYT
jgi:hypothetical protein